MDITLLIISLAHAQSTAFFLAQLSWWKCENWTSSFPVVKHSVKMMASPLNSLEGEVHEDDVRHKKKKKKKSIPPGSYL